MKHIQNQESDNLTGEEIETIKSLLNYPTLEKVFDQQQPQNLSSFKQKIRQNITDLERIIRRGSQSEAEKSAKVIKAFQTTFDFMEELESIRKEQSP